MPRELLDAYRRTIFCADTPRGRLALRIGQCNADLDLLLAEHECETWAYITAYNPGSVLLAPEENRQRQARLERDLSLGGWVCFSGEGIGANGDWPPEASTLVLGIDADSAQRLGRAFGQNAIVMGCLGKPAELSILA